MASPTYPFLVTVSTVSRRHNETVFAHSIFAIFLDHTAADQVSQLTLDSSVQSSSVNGASDERRDIINGASGDIVEKSAMQPSSFNGANSFSGKPLDEEEEANRLIDQILDLQKTLDGL